MGDTIQHMGDTIREATIHTPMNLTAMIQTIPMLTMTHTVTIPMPTTILTAITQGGKK